MKFLFLVVFYNLQVEKLCNLYITRKQKFLYNDFINGNNNGLAKEKLYADKNDFIRKVFR